MAIPRGATPMSHFYSFNFPRVFLVVLAIVLSASEAIAHCDTMDGPVVQAARAALKTRNLNLVLIWVPKKDETEIKEAFRQTQIVRKRGRVARELADKYFFETVVRIHRMGEGEPYTGLKPAGTDLGPVIPVADKALATASVEPLLKLFPDSARSEIEKRFRDAIARKDFDANDVDAGRLYVSAYVSFLQYLEHIYEQKAARVNANTSHVKIGGTHYV